MNDDPFTPDTDSKKIIISLYEDPAIGVFIEKFEGKIREITDIERIKIKWKSILSKTDN